MNMDDKKNKKELENNLDDFLGYCYSYTMDSTFNELSNDGSKFDLITLASPLTQIDKDNGQK